MRYLIIPFLVLVLAGLSAPAQSTVAEALCSAYKPVAESALDLRRQGIPLATAESMARGAHSTDRNLYRYLIMSIRAIYENPDTMAQRLEDGTWHQLCVRFVMTGRL